MFRHARGQLAAPRTATPASAATRTPGSLTPPRAAASRTSHGAPRRGVAALAATALGGTVTGGLLAVGAATALAGSAGATVQQATHDGFGPAQMTTAQGVSRIIGGGVTDSAGHGVPNVTVDLWRASPNSPGRLLSSTRTTSQGHYALGITATTSEILYTTVVATSTWRASTSGEMNFRVSAPTLAHEVLTAAARLNGRPYVYGAAGPSAFDCSGLTRYVFGQYGRALVHNAADQYNQSAHVSQGAMQPGDLMFFTSSSGIYHVAIYAGNGTMWDANHPGGSVGQRGIWSSSYLVGRIS